ncbi:MULTISPECIES: isocitrate lyase/PEP mutase family protein [Pseudomonas]|jgi:carboxyvinyl-carboxyphosphonate phosphorylmutase|uniref:Oxaloacetate decarboxylase n=1 Tax=Pseudomonas flavocrustae TaxID=2991719 RepID=A0ABT6IJC1_9PSED|nr:MULTISPECIES: oxaloacetate decarboxylase [Pseudomonas]MDH4764573.1 oxaloacetate decarboxylase [Pseudomonas sp. CBMAI 2609]MDK8264122.1 oxaloacetate decarboxylase [Pseudomonas oryzihabitans]MDR6180403.1 carboxyvinyl-carboxyphosphonate phosphorylmutase [Pseudomonas sp. SORGH_AS_0211]MDR6228408.1 carboxyvinyl-carboxyphosphonate phosphorylmutase [Pseudomonas sp. SORGH_AS_0199]QNQ97727.1 oxaloacetate decarboxylase [Pseudomonas psychrotolerans]
MKPTSPHKLRLAFRSLLKSDSCYHTASVFDPMSARIANDLGFEMGILGGSVASLQVLAAPDFALITLSEFVEQATRIGRVARLPIIADADHGYGNALNVMRTITELERAGVAALTIEDTVLPAGYGRKSTDLVSVEEGIGKIKGALEARIDEALSIFARTNATELSTAEVISRTKAYEAAGADGICMVGIRDFAHLEEITQHLSVPVMLVTYGNPQLRDNARLAKAGVRVVVNGHAAYFAAIKATYDCLREQRDITASDLSASELSTKYSTLQEYRVWAREFMDVKE